MLVAETHRPIDAQGAARFGLQFGRGALGLRQLLQDGGAFLEERQSGFGQALLAGGPVEQADA